MHKDPIHPYRVAAEAWPVALGSHRAIVGVEHSTDAVLAHIIWRRRDLEPERKDIIVIDRATGKTIRNRFGRNFAQESAEVVFQPVTVPGEYEVYYLPFDQASQWGLDAGSYKAMEDTGDAEWLQRHTAIEGTAAASVLAIECRTPFDNAHPMGRPATAEEAAGLLEAYEDEPYLLFPTPREFPIRMDDRLPVRWIETGPSNELAVEACGNEYFAFQIGVFAARNRLQSLSVSFSDFVQSRTGILPVESSAKSQAGRLTYSAFRCFNLGGVDCHGKPFQKEVSVERGKVQALWFGVDIPMDIAPGEYAGTVTIQPANAHPRHIALRITIKPELLADRGDGEPWRHSRLRWLDSTVGSEDELVPPFLPVKVTGRTAKLLDRSLTFGANGLPTRIRSRGRDILISPIQFTISAEGRSFGVPPSGGIRILPPEGGTPSATSASWKANGRHPLFTLHTQAAMEFDGFVSYELSLRAERETFVDDIALHIPLRREIATYLMGMGHRGGKRPEHFDWVWDWSRHQDSVWIGDANAGLRIQLRDDSYEQPLKVKYLQKPLKLPRSWHNAGHGGCSIREVGNDCVLFKANCGARKMAAGEELRFDFTLLITPVKPIDTAKHFRTRHFHSDAPVKKAVEHGANNITIHHATSPYPYINCPFLTADRLRAHADEAHRRGLKLRTYYTVRELTNHVPELWALRSLGDEIFLPGDGGGSAWLQENLVTGYSPNWYHRFADGDVCAAITEAPSSRWHNYSLEGLRWLIASVGIDGIYIDDTNLDRTTMRRARRILERLRPGALVDLHSNNMYWGFYGLACTANVYMDLFPCIDSLWFGESFDYTRTSPDYWLTEISGIPFGLMGEVMPYARVANPWRAALYGMHARMPVGDPTHDPRPIFRVWDEFGIADAKMIGYWEKDCPVRTDHPDVHATAYMRSGKTLIALASWAEETTRVKLQIDWTALGLNSRKARLRAPRVEHFQDAATFRPSDTITVESQCGWMMILEHADRC